MNFQILISIFLLSYLIGTNSMRTGKEISSNAIAQVGLVSTDCGKGGASDKRCTKNAKEHLLLENGHSREYTKIVCNYGHRDTLDFYFTGDIGGKEFIKADGKTMDYAPTLGQLAVAAAMRKLNMGKAVEKGQATSMNASAKFHGEFVVNVGDNFYPHGVNEADAKQRFHNIIEAVYGKKSFLTAEENTATTKKNNGDKRSEPVWYSIAGNNDYFLPKAEQKEMLDKEQFTEHFELGRAQVNVQIGYSEKVDIWEFPAPYYVVQHEFVVVDQQQQQEAVRNKKRKRQEEKKAITMVMVMIDAVLLCGQNQRDFVNRPSAEKEKAKKEHEQWLDAVLKQHVNDEKKKANFLFVAGHYPIYRDAEDKSAFPCVPFLQNMMKKYKVSAYFAGHEHSLQHLHKDGVEHVVSGAGSRMQNCWPNYLRFGATPESQMSLLGGEIKMCYPNGLTREQLEKNRAELQKWSSESGIKPRPGWTDFKTLGPRVEAFDGGAFVTIRLDAEKAELKFWATGGNLYPGWNLHDKITNKKESKQHQIMEEEIPNPIQWDPASMKDQKFLKDIEANVKTKFLGQTEIKSRAIWGEHVEETDEDAKKIKRL